MGAKQRGKTTTLMTLMCSAALMYTPARVTFFCIGGATLAQVQDLPHVADIVVPSDTEGLVRTVATMEALIRSREEAFRRGSIDIDDFRDRRFGPGSDSLGGTDSNDPYGDVFLVIDDFSKLYERDTMLGDRIITLSADGPGYGVHVMSSAPGWIHGQRQNLLQNVNARARIQLRLADPGETQMGDSSVESRDAARRTLDSPGFGLTYSVHEMLIGFPVLAEGAAGAGSTRDVGPRVAEVAGVAKHATLKRLPERIALPAILEYSAAHRDADDLSIAFSIGEQNNLAPVEISLPQHPGMLIVGRQGCGKSTALAAIGEAVMSRFGPDEAQLTIVDPKTGPLRDRDAPGYVRAYAYDQDEIDEVINQLVQDVLLPRVPAKGLTQEELRSLKGWEGARHFVLIDDVQDLRPEQTYPVKPPVGAALWKLMERARQIGLHVFTTRNSGNFAALEMDRWVKFQRSAKVPTLYMDNDPQNKVNQWVRVQALPPGRGLLVTNDTEVEGILVGAPAAFAGAGQPQ